MIYFDRLIMILFIVNSITIIVLARSAQTYKIISVDFKQYKKMLDSIQDKDKNKIPCAIRVNTTDKNLDGDISVHYIDPYKGNMIETLFIEFNLSDQRCYVIGSSKGRIELIKILNRLLENDEEIDIIQPIDLPGRCIYEDMLKILTDSYSKHFIKNLKNVFGKSGFKSPLDKHKVETIEYGFTYLTCASEHKKALDYIENAIFTRVKFAVWNIGKFYKMKPDQIKIPKPIHIDVTTDYTFRFYWTYDNSEILSVMKALDVDYNIYLLHKDHM